jgi:hypothetical protein
MPHWASGPMCGFHEAHRGIGCRAEWHTHLERHPEPSRVDRRPWRTQIVKHKPNPMVFDIARSATAYSEIGSDERLITAAKVSQIALERGQVCSRPPGDGRPICKRKRRRMWRLLLHVAHIRSKHEHRGRRPNTKARPLKRAQDSDYPRLAVVIIWQTSRILERRHRRAGSLSRRGCKLD